MPPSCRLVTGEFFLPATHPEAERVWWELMALDRSKCPLSCVLSNEGGRVWKEMEAESAR